MNSSILTFFSNKGGVGQTALVYHLAWMFAELEKRVIVVDLDPQANLTAAFWYDEKIETLWLEQARGSSIYQSLKPLTENGELVEPELHQIAEDLYLIPGDLNLSTYEERFSNEWVKSLGDQNLYRSMRILSAFWQVMQMAARKVEADLILVDIGPNLSAINRSALIATDYVILPLGTDIFSWQGLKNLGPTLISWKTLWQERLTHWKTHPESEHYPDFELPEGKMQSIGYLCQQYRLRLTRPITVYDKWPNLLPNVYRQDVLNNSEETDLKPTDDPYCLAIVKHYRSLIEMSQEHRLPVFKLRPAHGAIGSYAITVQVAKQDFKQLAQMIADKMDIKL